MDVTIVTVHERAYKHILVGFSLKMSQMMTMMTMKLKSSFLYFHHFHGEKKKMHTGMFGSGVRKIERGRWGGGKKERENFVH